MDVETNHAKINHLRVFSWYNIEKLYKEEDSRMREKIKRAFFPILKERRESVSYSQIEVADMLGVSQSLISRWERGEAYPKFPQLKIMADLYSCKIEELYIEIS